MQPTLETHIQLAKTEKDPTSILILKSTLENYCLDGHFDKAKDLLEKVKGIFDINFDDGYLFVSAASWKNWEMFDFLLENGANLECCYLTPVLNPTNEELINRLIAHGINPDILKCTLDVRDLEGTAKYRIVSK